MKSILKWNLVFLLLLSCPAFSEEPPTQAVSAFYGGEMHDYLLDAVSIDGNKTVMGGYTFSFGTDESADAWLVCIDSLGNTLWSAEYGDYSEECVYAVEETQENGFVMAGFKRTGWNDSDAILIKTDSSGGLLWIKEYGGVEDDAFTSVDVTDDGGFICCGSTRSYSASGQNGWIVKTDRNGNTIWNKHFGTDYDDIFMDILPLEDGGFIAAGNTDTVGEGNSFGWVLKTDDAGEQSWSRVFGNEKYNSFNSVTLGLDGDIILGGSVKDYSEISDAWLLKTNENGDKLWEKFFGGTSSDDCYALTITYDGGYLLGGRTGSFGTGSYDMWLIRTDSNGEQLWDTTFGGENTDACRSVVTEQDGGYMLIGSTTSYGAGGYDGYVVKTTTEPSIAFSLISPVDRDTIQSLPLLFDWEDTALDDSVKYILLVDDDTTFSSPLEKSDIITSEYVLYDSLETIGYYNWKVIASGTGSGLHIPSSQTGRFLFCPDYLKWRLKTAEAFDGEIKVEGIDNDDYVFIRFNRTTDCPEINADNIDSILKLSGGHSWLDGFGNLGPVLWNEEGDGVIINLTTYLEPPSISVGDTISPDYFYMSDSSIVLGGSFYTTHVDEGCGSGMIPSDLRLGPASPNPFNPETIISFELPRQTPAKLSIYDLSGRLVDTLLDKTIPAGRYNISWHAVSRVSGVYICRLETTNPHNVRTLKLLLLK